MNQKNVLLIIFILLVLPISTTAWHPYGNNIFQNQRQDTLGIWTNESYNDITTVTNSGVKTDLQPLTQDIDGDGNQEVVMTDGTYVKILTLETLGGEAELNVGTIAGQMAVEQLDGDPDYEMVVVGTKDDVSSLWLIGWDGTSISYHRYNITGYNTSVQMAGASPKCWYQTEAGKWGYNVPYCFFRTYNDTYVKINLLTEAQTHFQWSGAYNTGVYSTPSIPILANIDADVNVVPEFFIMRKFSSQAELVMLDADTWQPSAVFDGGTGNVVKQTNGLMYVTGLEDKGMGQPILYNPDGLGGYEILLNYGSYASHCSYCHSWGSWIGTIDTNGDLLWANSEITDGCGVLCTGSSSYTKVTAPLVADFWDGSEGDEICFLYSSGIATANRLCYDSDGTPLEGSGSGTLGFFRDYTETIGQGFYYDIPEESYAVDFNGDGSMEYVNGIGIFGEMAGNSDDFRVMINSYSDFGLGAQNSKAPMPVLDDDGNVQYLWSDDTGNDYSGTRYFTTGIMGEGAPSENDLPNITSIATNPASNITTTGVPIQFVISTTDTESDTIYTARKCQASESMSSYMTTNTWSCTYTSAGFYTIQVSVTDNVHLGIETRDTFIDVEVTSSSIYCGDSICQEGETTETCPADCSTETTGSTVSFQTDLQIDLVNINAPFGDASQQGLLGNIYLGIIAFLSYTIMPIFYLMAMFSILMVVLIILKKISEA